MNMKTSEVLDLAADKIQENGWGQGPLTWEGQGGLCLEGGIVAAMGLPVVNGAPRGLLACPAYRAVRDYLEPFTKDVDNPYSMFPWYFNDRIAESADDVIAVLRSAAAVERVRESVYETEDQPLPVEIPASVA